MTKSELANKISKETGIEVSNVSTIIDAFGENVQKALQDGDEVSLRGFATFKRKTRAQKVARNISKGTSIIVPEHDIPVAKFHFELDNERSE